MLLYVARHGETFNNTAGLINGQSNDVLTAKGQKQATDLAEKLKDIHLDTIYTSTLQRALDTGAPTALEHSINIIQDSRLMEVDFGLLTVQPYSATVKDFGLPASALLSTYTYDLSLYKGETSEQVRARVQAFMNDIKRADNESALVITHGGIFRWFHYLIEGKKIQLTKNAELHTFEL